MKVHSYLHVPVYWLAGYIWSAYIYIAIHYCHLILELIKANSHMNFLEIPTTTRTAYITIAIQTCKTKLISWKCQMNCDLHENVYSSRNKDVIWPYVTKFAPY